MWLFTSLLWATGWSEESVFCARTHLLVCSLEVVENWAVNHPVCAVKTYFETTENRLSSQPTLNSIKQAAGVWFSDCINKTPNADTSVPQRTAGSPTLPLYKRVKINSYANFTVTPLLVIWSRFRLVTCVCAFVLFSTLKGTTELENKLEALRPDTETWTTLHINATCDLD